MILKKVAKKFVNALNVQFLNVNLNFIKIPRFESKCCQILLSRYYHIPILSLDLQG